MRSNSFHFWTFTRSWKIELIVTLSQQWPISDVHFVSCSRVYEWAAAPGVASPQWLSDDAAGKQLGHGATSISLATSQGMCTGLVRLHASSIYVGANIHGQASFNHKL